MSTLVHVPSYHFGTCSAMYNVHCMNMHLRDLGQDLSFYKWKFCPSVRLFLLLLESVLQTSCTHYVIKFPETVHCNG